MVCITVPTSGSAANADIQTNDSLDGVHDVNTFEFVNGADDSVLMAINKANGLDINMDTVITPSNATDPPLTVNDSTDSSLFVVKNNGEVQVMKGALAPSIVLNNPITTASNTSADFIKCTANSTSTKFRVDSSGNTTTYGANVQGVLNVDGGMNVRDNGVPKFIVLSDGSVFAEAPFQSRSIVIQNPQETGSNTYGDYIVCHVGDTDVFKVDNTAGIWGSALTINNPVQTGYNPDGDYVRCGSVLKLDSDGNTTLPKTSISNTGVISTKGNIVVTDSVGTAKVTLSTSGIVALPNADIAATGVITTKGGISVRDSGAVEKINLSNAGVVTLPNASISTTGLVTTKGGISVTDSGAVEKINLSNAGVVTLPNASISTTGLVTTKGGISVTDSGAVEKINLSNAGVVTLPNASISTTGLVTTKGGVSVTDSGAIEKINLSNAGVVTLPNADIAASGLLTTKGGISVKNPGTSVETINMNATSGDVTVSGVLYNKGGISVKHPSTNVEMVNLAYTGVITSKGGGISVTDGVTEKINMNAATGDINTLGAVSTKGNITVKDGSNVIQLTLTTAGAINCNAIALAGTPTVGQVGYMKSVVSPIITEQTSGSITTIGSLSLEAGTWILCADVLFASTVAGKTLDSCAIAISTQQVTLPNLEHGFYQTGIAMSMPTINTYYKPGTITRTYQGAATTMYLISSLLCVTPVNFIKAMAVNFTATRIA